MRLHPQPENHSVSPGLLARPASGFPSIVPSQETAPEKWAAALDVAKTAAAGMKIAQHKDRLDKYLAQVK